MSGFELNWDEIDIWSLKLKALLIAALCAVIIGLGAWQLLYPQWELLKTKEDKELTLRETFESKQSKAARLSQLKIHLKHIRENYSDMVRRLPSKAEVSSLLADISQTGISNNLEFKLFKPEGERSANFYVELPIKIRVTGEYHDFGRFVADLAVLPRIVTLNNIRIRTLGKTKVGEKNILQFDATVKTYRYAGK